MALVVLKFGGTSLANTKLMKNAVCKVIEEVALGNEVIVVVSAMAGVTDHLVSLVGEITECNNQYSSLEYANVITTGEQVSAGLFALLLQQDGIKARSWLGWQAGIVTDDNIVDGEIIELNCKPIIESFSQGYQVAVVTGFQGITKDNRISTLGRGGSDTTAIILAGALEAIKCDIYTDVEGVFTADPRIVAKAQKLESINYDEMIELANAGAKVLQAKSVEWAKHYQVRLQVLSSFTNHSGTFIDNFSSHYIAGIAISKNIDEVYSKLDVARITIIGTNVNDKNLLESLKENLNYNAIDVLASSANTMSISFIVKEEDKFEAIRFIHTICELDETFNI